MQTEQNRAHGDAILANAVRTRGDGSLHLCSPFYPLYPLLPMKKFLAATAVLLSTALAAPAFAQTTVNQSATVASSADLACMSAAVEARENAVLSARTSYNAGILAAITARKVSLQAAYTIANNNDRRVAIKAALNAYATAHATARATFKTGIKAAWSAYATARINCRIDVDMDKPGKHLGRDRDRDDDDHDRGLHLGQLKKANVKAGANGSAKLDLSF